MEKGEFFNGKTFSFSFTPYKHTRMYFFLIFVYVSASLMKTQNNNAASLTETVENQWLVVIVSTFYTSLRKFTCSHRTTIAHHKTESTRNMWAKNYPVVCACRAVFSVYSHSFASHLSGGVQHQSEQYSFARWINITFNSSVHCMFVCTYECTCICMSLKL